MEMIYMCQNCEEVYHDEDDLINPIPDWHERVAPGETMPAGECPKCGALAYSVETLEEHRAKSKGPKCPECGEDPEKVIIDGQEYTLPEFYKTVAIGEMLKSMIDNGLLIWFDKVGSKVFDTDDLQLNTNGQAFQLTLTEEAYRYHWKEIVHEIETTKRLPQALVEEIWGLLASIVRDGKKPHKKTFEKIFKKLDNAY